MRFEPTSAVNGTSLRGYVIATYDQLVEALGTPRRGPNYQSADGKVTCEWALEYEDGTIVTVYDWKEDSTPMHNYAWHIGGYHDGKAIERIIDTLEKLEITDEYPHLD